MEKYIAYSRTYNTVFPNRNSAVMKYIRSHQNKKNHLVFGLQLNTTFCMEIDLAADLRATLHSDGAYSIKALITDIATLAIQLHPATLEILTLVQIYLVIHAIVIRIVKLHYLAHTFCALQCSIIGWCEMNKVIKKLTGIKRRILTYFVRVHPHGRTAPNTPLHSSVRHG